jgi:hypothetical protein
VVLGIIKQKIAAAGTDIKIYRRNLNMNFNVLGKHFKDGNIHSPVKNK